MWAPDRPTVLISAYVTPYCKKKWSEACARARGSPFHALERYVTVCLLRGWAVVLTGDFNAKIGTRQPGAAEAALHRHLGLCYDVCHAAVEFEDARTSIQALQATGISISKLQLSSAMRIAEVGPETAQRLQAFVEPVYLHQVVEQGPDGLRRYTDLPDALAKIEAAMGREWRIHFHVPIFLDKMAEVGTTQGFLRDILAIQRDTPVTQQLEVETYTWDVLPETYRNAGVSAAIARELSWVRDQLAPCTSRWRCGLAAFPTCRRCGPTCSPASFWLVAQPMTPGSGPWPVQCRCFMSAACILTPPSMRISTPSNGPNGRSRRVRSAVPRSFGSASPCWHSASPC